MMDSKDYGFYEVKLVGTDATEIIIGSSLESVKAEMEEVFGDDLDSVRHVAGEELASSDPIDAETNHRMNVSVLTGRNPFCEDVNEMTGITKAITHPSATGKSAFEKKKEQLKKELEAMKDKSKGLDPKLGEAWYGSKKQPTTTVKKSSGVSDKDNELSSKIQAHQKANPGVSTVRSRMIAKGLIKADVDVSDEDAIKQVNEISKELLAKARDKGIHQAMKHGIGGREKSADGKTFTYKPPTNPEYADKKAKQAGRFAKLLKKKNQKEEVEVEEGAIKRIATSQSNKTDRSVANDKLKPGLETYQKKPVEEENLDEKGDDYRFGPERRAMTKRDTKRNPQNKDQYEETDYKSLVADYLKKGGTVKKGKTVAAKGSDQGYGQSGETDHQKTKKIANKRGTTGGEIDGSKIDIKAKEKAKNKNVQQDKFRGGDESSTRKITTGAKKRMAFQNRAPIRKKVTEETLMEGEDKLAYLMRIGLMQKNEILLVRRAMKLRKSNTPMSVRHRDILFKLLDRMIGLILKHPQMYNQAKRKIFQEAMDEAFAEIQDKELVESFVYKLDEAKKNPCWTGYKKVPGKKDYEDGSCVKEDEELEEAGYNDPPTTKAEVKKKYPDIETDVKNKKSIELQSLKYK